MGCYFLLQCMKVKSESGQSTLWTAAYQAPLPLGFSRKEYWSGLPLLNCIIANFKAPKLSGYLVDLSAVITQLQLHSMNATATNPDRRGQKAQHHHSFPPSALEVAFLSRILPFTGFSDTKGAPGSRFLRTLHVTAADAFCASSICLALLTAEPRQDWSRA